MTKRVRLAVVGGNRGASFDSALADLQEQVELAAVCDLSEQVLAGWQTRHPGVQAFTSYEAMLDSGACEAVLLATPMELHASQAVQALEAGLHVLSEVIAATTLEECWELVETVERTGRTYMLAENCCYFRANMLVLNLAQQGMFGELTYAEGAYIHDCRRLSFTTDGALTWRGSIRRRVNGDYYPTHALGPVAQWLGLGRQGGDCLVSAATFMTATRSPQIYVREAFGPDHPGAQDGYWKNGDSATTVIRTANGAVIVLRMDASSPRPHDPTTHYALQGTRGAYHSERHSGEDPLVWLEGASPQLAWESLWTHSPSHEHPYWQAWRAQAAHSGHGGGDFFVLRDFVSAVQNGTRPPIDVYDAVTWSSIAPLSMASVAQGGAPVPVPDFRRG